jgi:hypothetical protein
VFCFLLLDGFVAVVFDDHWFGVNMCDARMMPKEQSADYQNEKNNT